MKIILVDNNPDFRNDLKFFLEKYLPYTIIAETENAKEFLKLENQKEADIILMDLSMEKMNDFIAVKKILSRFPSLKIIAMTFYTEILPVLKLMDIGFMGFIIKTEIFKYLEVIMQSVYSNEFVFSKGIYDNIVANLSKNNEYLLINSRGGNLVAGFSVKNFVPII
jgi:DNA-binding NarL/FixJ family response regulator